MRYTIGSFNMLKMSYQHDEDISKDFVKIARIINEEQFDVVALQEVFQEAVIKNFLIPALGANKWDYVWDSPTPFSASSNEGYAYIWQKKKLRLIEANDNPKIYNQYRIKDHIGQDGVIRPPYVARFTPSGMLGGSNFEIRLINTHIIFGKPSQSDLKISDAELRRQELKVLSEEVYRLVSTKRYGTNMPAYTILLGDYNLCLAGGGPTIDEVIPITSTRSLKTVQREKTSLKMSTTMNEKDTESTEYYSQNYDHFSYEVTLLDKMRLTDSRVEALGKYYNNNLEAFRKEVSDHVPIKLSLDLKTR